VEKYVGRREHATHDARHVAGKPTTTSKIDSLLNRRSRGTTLD